MNGYYIALKNTVFNGIGFTAGSIVPAEAVLPSRIPALLRNGIIAKADEESTPPTVSAKTPQTEPKVDERIILPIKAENGTLELSASQKDIVRAIEIMQMNADDATTALFQTESEETLIIVDACDSRKTIKKVIKDRVVALQNEEESTEESGEE